MDHKITDITVFGGTGMLGKPVVRALLEAGYRVTVMVRDPDRAADLLPDSAILVQGDLTRKKDILSALDGADAAYLNLSTRPDVKKYHSFIAERDGLENILAAVNDINGVQPVSDIQPASQTETHNGKSRERSLFRIKRVSAISSMVHRYQGVNGFAWWVFEIKQWAQHILNVTNVPTTIFYPSTFMETIDQGGIMQGNRLMLVGRSRHPMYFISGLDYGRMVAEDFRRMDEENRAYDIQGTESFRFDEAALIFAKNFRHRPLKITKVPMWPVKLMGLLNDEVGYLGRIMEALNNYEEPEPDESVWRLLGRPGTTLEEYACDCSA